MLQIGNNCIKGIEIGTVEGDGSAGDWSGDTPSVIVKVKLAILIVEGEIGGQ